MAVTRLDISVREPLLNGKAFGKTGPYEILRGSVTFAADPAALPNQGIVDLDKAPRNAAGQVEWWADFTLLRPADPQQGNRRLLFEVVNRGRILAFRMFDAVAGTSNLHSPEQVGNGFLLQQGYTLAWCGWQWDVMRLEGMFGAGIPQAMDGTTPVGGKVLCQWWPTVPAAFLLLADRDHKVYPSVDTEDQEAVLTVREHENAPRQVIPRHQWRFARVTRGEPVPATTHAWLASGFQPGKIYECVYRTQQAPVVGLGLLGVRDVVSFLKYNTEAQQNPCAGQLEQAYGFGASQSGRFLRHFLYRGLNTDETGRMVFDGLMPHIAGARRGEFNQRFAQPSAATLHGPSLAFPFTDHEQVDPLTQQRDGLLRRLLQAGHCPKIIYTNSSSEYWRGDASLSHISGDGSADVTLPEQVRLYMFASTQHTPGKLPLTDRATDGSRGQYPLNSLDYTPLLRAALVQLDRWVSQGEAPPPSRYPRLADGSAVPASSVGAVFTSLPRHAFPTIFPQPHRLDFATASGQDSTTCIPSKVGEPYQTFVAAVDADGNEIAGIRLPDVAVPLATYTGWNLRHPSQGAPEQTFRTQGATIPLAPTSEARAQSADPRAAIAERYASKEAYLALVTKAAEALVSERYLLPEDMAGVVQRAAQRYDVFMGQK
ncbi:MAG: alpha/beta hydrolase domain-containing protein [Candidatus Tectimicrobiota bacterium]